MATAFTAVKLLGASYLIYLGVQAIRRRGGLAEAFTTAAPASRRGTVSMLRDGLVVGSARAWFARSPRRLAAVGGAGGLVMIGLGTSLALTGRKDRHRIIGTGRVDLQSEYACPPAGYKLSWSAAICGGVSTVRSGTVP
ncbi:hypothetical protein IRT45_02635 [Nocardia sp. BSTN01]|nr:hypothetical protein [Nocardia sp. BSTN01]